MICAVKRTFVRASWLLDKSFCVSNFPCTVMLFHIIGVAFRSFIMLFIDVIEQCTSYSLLILAELTAKIYSIHLLEIVEFIKQTNSN